MNLIFENTHTYENFISCSDINGSGIKRFTPSPVITSILNTKGVKIANNSNDFDRYIIASGVTHRPNDWCGADIVPTKYSNNSDDRINLFKLLNPTYLQDLRSKKAFLLLDQTHEGYHYHWLFDWFHNSCAELNIPIEQIIYITGNLDAERNYNDWINRRIFTGKMLVLGHPHFETAVHTSAVNIRNNGGLLPTVDDHLAYKQNTNNSVKLYNALQKRSRSHRMWLFRDLYFENLLNDGINSMNFFSPHEARQNNKDMDVTEYDQFKHLLPMMPPSTEESSKELSDFAHDDSGKYQTKFNDDVMLQTWVSVISEASFDDDYCFISEKTFKPIACCHPFIVYGNKNSLRYLRDLGYKTFHPYIDETYDTLNTWERLSAIINALQKIKAMSNTERVEWLENMRPILEFNANILTENSKRYIPTAIIRIQDYINNVSTTN